MIPYRSSKIEETFIIIDSKMDFKLKELIFDRKIKNK